MSDSLNLAYDPVSLLEICLTYIKKYLFTANHEQSEESIR